LQGHVEYVGDAVEFVYAPYDRAVEALGEVLLCDAESVGELALAYVAAGHFGADVGAGELGACRFGHVCDCDTVAGMESNCCNVVHTLTIWLNTVTVYSGGMNTTAKRTTTAALLGGAIAAALFGATGPANADTAQYNAVKTAESYLKHSGFSRQGLIEQLEYEQFSAADAAYAVDHISVNWNSEALESAHSYLKHSSFSPAGLEDQLQYEGFTQAQAVYAVSTAYGDGGLQGLD
jgi:hypothetical protein